MRAARSIRPRLAAALSVLLLGLPLPHPAHAGPGSAQDMLTTASNASLPSALANLDMGAVWGKAYGMKCDGSTDDTTALENTVAAAVSPDTTIYLPQGTCVISLEVDVGNGTASAVSTVNGITIQGGGAPFVRQSQVTGNLGNVGTIIKWNGATSTTAVMMKVLGPEFGIAFKNVAFDAANKAGTCLEMVSASRAVLPNVTCSNYTGTGILVTTQTGGSGLSDNSVFGSDNLVFIDPELDTLNTGTTAVQLDGDGAAGIHDTTRVSLIDPVLAIPATGGTIGLKFAFTDQDIVSNLVASLSGTADGTECTVQFASSDSGNFPQNITFPDAVDLGNGGNACVTGGAIGPGIDLGRFNLVGGANLPSATVAQYARYRAQDSGSFPTGGFWSEGGLAINERGLRNKLINSGFWRASRGATFTNPASNTYTLDLWKLAYDGTQTETVSQQAFGVGQTAVPYSPQDYLQWVYGTNTGGTYNELFQDIESVATFAGRKMTLSFWAQAPTGCTSPTITPFVLQNFGTGGSPSAVVQTNGAAISPTASWAYYSATIAVPSISGKTLGTNGNDYLAAGWNFGVGEANGCTIDIADPQAEYGQTATAYEIRPKAVDEALAARYLRPIGTGLDCMTSATTTFECGAQFDMRAAPTLLIAPGYTASLSVSCPGVATYTTTTPSIASDFTTAHGSEFHVGGFTSMTAAKQCFGESDFGLADAEY